MQDYVYQHTEPQQVKTSEAVIAPECKKVIIVVPTIREHCIQEFLAAWRTEFATARVIVIEDNPTPTFDLSHHAHVSHYAWQNIEQDLGQAHWIIPRRTDCIRSYGYYKAYQECPDMIITLDDDCFPVPGQPNFIQTHWSRIQQKNHQEAWVSTGNGTISRGVPYYNRSRAWPNIINHGLWVQTPDYDAPTQLLQSRYNFEFVNVSQTIPAGMYFPMCGMNLAFLPQVVPAFYFLLMGKEWGYDRLGDIWAGVIVKKICDHLGYTINSGEPFIVHQRASNVWDNLQKEAIGLRVNEGFWQLIDSIVLRESTFSGCYREIAEHIKSPDTYWNKLAQAMCLWTELFEDHQND